MAINHIQTGAVMPYTNAGETTITADSVVLVGTRIGIALGDIAADETGQLAIEEVWSVPKAAPLVIAQGDLVYWDATDGEVNKTATDNTQAGFAFAAAASADTTVQVKING